tara:strand:- start:6139 stop:6762 length:624 start_codon:yes stop_codon:yes gene_type:complete
MSIFAKLNELKRINHEESDPVELPDGTVVTIGTLTSAEDRDVVAYASKVSEGFAYAHEVKLESLAYAIKHIRFPDGHEVDLRNVQFMGIGEYLEGEELKKPCHVVVRDIVHSWPDIVADTLFAKYAQLYQRVDERTKRVAQIELMDATLKVRIEELDTELCRMVRDADHRGLKVDARLLAYVKGDFSPVELEEDAPVTEQPQSISRK